MPCPLSSSGLAHLYVSCKGGDGEIGGHSFSFADGGVQGKDQNANAGSINPHLCQNRKGGPATPSRNAGAPRDTRVRKLWSMK
jgi:hypothetical protein